MYMTIIDYFLDKLSNLLSFSWLIRSKEKKNEEKEYDIDPLLRI
jgi:hypothetical protein